MTATASPAATTPAAPVLIVGAGPTGLTLAIELARRGVPYRIIEAADGPRPGSRGKGVQPRTLELFERIGIADRVIADGRFAMPIVTTLPDGTVKRGGAEPAELHGRPDIPYTTSLITPQWRVEEALERRLGELGGAVEYGTALGSFGETEAGVLAVVEAHGVSETIEARWLVGADGGHSFVRKSVGIAFEGETHEEVRMIVADVAATVVGEDGTETPLDRDAWRMWWSATGMASLCPLPSTGVFALQASVAEGQDPSLTLANMQAILDARAPGSGIRLAEPEWSSLWRANIRLAERYRAGRVLLAGDAAHIHTPAGGQGMNTGIQDAMNLGWKLAAVAAGAPESLLDSYEEERRPIATGVLGLSNDRFRQTLEQREIKRDASTIQLGLGYRGSSLAVDDRPEDADLRAGDRAPDATGLVTPGGTHRIFELIAGDAFTLLAFGEGAAVDVAGSEAAPAGLCTLRIAGGEPAAGEVVDSAGTLAAAYGAGPRTLVLIRPDGYIAAISDAGDLAVVERALAAVGAAAGVAEPGSAA